MLCTASHRAGLREGKDFLLQAPLENRASDMSHAVLPSGEMLLWTM